MNDAFRLQLKRVVTL